MKISLKIIASALFTYGLLASGPDSANAEMFKWKDDSGKWHFTENPASIPKKYRNKDKVDTLESEQPAKITQAPVRKARPPKRGQILP